MQENKTGLCFGPVIKFNYKGTRKMVHTKDNNSHNKNHRKYHTGQSLFPAFLEQPVMIADQNADL